jgi:hypothetical protein
MQSEALMTFDGCFGREIGHLFESGDVLGATVRVSAVIDSIHAEIDVIGSQHFGPSQRIGKKNGVAGRHIGDGNLGWHRFGGAVFRDGQIRGKGRAAEATKIDVHDQVLFDPNVGRDPLSGLDLDLVSLSIAKAEGVTAEALLPGDRKDRSGVKATAEEYDGGSLRRRHGLSLINPERKRHLLDSK